MNRLVPCDLKTRRRAASTLPCFVLVVILFSACRNDMEKIAFFDKKELPQQSLDSVSVVRSENGIRQMKMEAPKVLIFEQPQKKTEYPQGFTMTIFDNNRLASRISANYAYTLDEKKIMEARDSVVIIDYQNGDTFYLHTLVWNQGEHHIFSNDPVRSVNGQRVTYGDGFESDDEFTSPYIFPQRGTIEVEEMKIESMRRELEKVLQAQIQLKSEKYSLKNLISS